MQAAVVYCTVYSCRGHFLVTVAKDPYRHCAVLPPGVPTESQRHCSHELSLSDHLDDSSYLLQGQLECFHITPPRWKCKATVMSVIPPILHINVKKGHVTILDLFISLAYQWHVVGIR